MVSLDDPCQHLDPDTHLCIVYERRFEVNPGCLSVAKGIHMRVFPEDCPYVADRRDYAGPLYGLSSEEILELIERHEEGAS